MIGNIKFNYINRSIRNMNFASIHLLLSYMKDLISININNLYILRCNDPLVPK